MQNKSRTINQNKEKFKTFSMSRKEEWMNEWVNLQLKEEEEEDEEEEFAIKRRRRRRRRIMRNLT